MWYRSKKSLSTSAVVRFDKQHLSSKTPYEPDCLRIPTTASQENFSLHKSNRLSMNDQITLVVCTMSVSSANVQRPKFIEAPPDNLSTHGIEPGKHGCDVERNWINEVWQTWNLKPELADMQQFPYRFCRSNSRCWQKASKQVQHIFSRWRKRGTFKNKQYQEHKTQQKRVRRSRFSLNPDPVLVYTPKNGLPMICFQSSAESHLGWYEIGWGRIFFRWFAWSFEPRNRSSMCSACANFGWFCPSIYKLSLVFPEFSHPTSLKFHRTFFCQAKRPWHVRAL